MRKTMWKKSRRNVNCGKLFGLYNRTIDGYNNIDYNNLIKMIKEDKDVILLDVRSIQEYNEGHLNGAILIPLYELEKTVTNIIPDKKKKIIVYCKSGIRSMKAIEVLLKKGYVNLYNLYGGLDNY